MKKDILHKLELIIISFTSCKRISLIIGKIPETRYSLDPDDKELKTFAVTCHQDCLLSTDTGTGTAAGTLGAGSSIVLA